MFLKLRSTVRSTCTNVSLLLYKSHFRLSTAWLGSFSTGGCCRFLLLTWWTVAEFRARWGRQNVEMECTKICCEIGVVFGCIGNFGWSTQVSPVTAVLVPTWLHRVGAWADMLENDGRVPYFGCWAPCHSHLVTWAQRWKITCTFAVMVEFLSYFLLVQTLHDVLAVVWCGCE